MGALTIHQTDAATKYSQLCDTEGRLVLLPSAVVDWLRAQGKNTITLTVGLGLDVPAAEWLTVTEAAEKLMDEDVDGLTLDSAKKRVTRACDRGTVTATGEGHRRRIDPISLNAWRLDQRNQNLKDLDDGRADL